MTRLALRVWHALGAAAWPAARLMRRSRSRKAFRRLGALDHPAGNRIAAALANLQSYPEGEAISLLDQIEQERTRLLAHTEPLVDGTLGDGTQGDRGTTVAAACRASKQERACRLLFFLAREFRVQRGIELGTNLGLSSAYLGAAMKLQGQGSLVTLEGSPYRLRIAREWHRRLGLDNIAYAEGSFAKILSPTLEEFGPVDFAFIDGHHKYRPTLDYFAEIRAHATEEALFIFDDIRWSHEMRKAWAELQRDPHVTLAVDLGHVGLCVTARSPTAQSQSITRIDY